MSVEYSHKKVGGDYEIYRNEEYVATYDPVTEVVTYAHGDDKYSAPIGREIAKIIRGSKPGDTDIDPDDTDPGVPMTTLEERVTMLENHVTMLENHVKLLEGADTAAPIAPFGVVRTPNRFKDAVDLTGAPVQDPLQGDLTPEFIEWARNGGMEPEVFKRRYHGRIKDLSHVDDPKEG